jgi:hypothetical protein
LLLLQGLIALSGTRADRQPSGGHGAESTARKG